MKDFIVAAFLIFIFGGIVGALAENRYMQPKIEYREVVKTDTVIVSKVDKKLIKDNKKLKIYISNLKEDLERAEKSLLEGGGR